MKIKTISTALLMAVPLAALAGEPDAGLDENLKAFEPFVGKTWRAEQLDPKSGKKMVDVSRWERTLNGQAVRILHSVNDGQYAGETIVMYDPESKGLRFWYFTSAGFFTEGTGSFDGQKFVSLEKVTASGEGPAKGITEVRATAEVLDGGKTLKSKSEYLKDGEWVPGHAFTYVEAPDAKVVMR